MIVPISFLNNFFMISLTLNLVIYSSTETLIHSSMEQCDGADFTFKMITDRERTVYVRKRPFLQEFLAKVSEMFEIIIFTASKRMYAETLLDVLDPDKKFFSRRVCRESCTWKDRCCVKDLTVLGIDLAKVCIIDNTPEVLFPWSFVTGFQFIISSMKQYLWCYIKYCIVGILLNLLISITLFNTIFCMQSYYLGEFYVDPTK